MTVQEVRELFNHPLGEAEMRRVLAALDADPSWGIGPRQDDADQLTFVLLHRPSGTEVPVAQERSIVGMWNSMI